MDKKTTGEQLRQIYESLDPLKIRPLHHLAFF